MFPSTNPSGVMIVATFALSCAIVTFLQETVRWRSWMTGTLAVVAASASLMSLSRCRRVAQRHRTRNHGRCRWGGDPETQAAPSGGCRRRERAGVSDGQHGPGVTRGWATFGTADLPFVQLLFRNLVGIPFLWLGSLGTYNLGWVDTAMPSVVGLPMIGAFLAVVVLALRSARRLTIVAVSTLLLAMTAVPLMFLAREGSIIPGGFQPRYLLPAMSILPAIAILGRRSDGRRLLSGVQAGLIVIAASVANAAALHTNLRRYVWGLGRGGVRPGCSEELVVAVGTRSDGGVGRRVDRLRVPAGRPRPWDAAAAEGSRCPCGRF